MILGLKPYPVMKDSGVPWLGQVPEHWEVRRAKWLFTLKNRPVRDIDEVVTCFRDGTVTLRKNRRIRGFTESLKEIGYQGIRRGDLVIHAMDAFAGAIGVADSDGKGTPVYSVCEPTTEANSFYYAFVLREMARSQWIQALAKGIRERSTDFRFDDFGSQLVPVPPVPEQVGIVRFVKHEDLRIQRYIEAKQKLIKLLEEQKQAIIHRAVTRGLDPNVRLKPSGVEWLGDVPEHWDVTRIKTAFSSMVYGISESGTNTGAIRLLTMGHLREGKVIVPTVGGGVDAVDPSLLLEKNDLLFNRTNSAELVGKVGLFGGADEPVTFASYLVRMRPRPDMSPAFLNLLLNDSTILSVARREAIPSLHQSNLNPTRYGRLHVALPDVIQQEAVVRYIASATVGLDTVIDRARRELVVFREYLTRFVADVVTGKLDVRKATTTLLTETAEAESLDEPDTDINNYEQVSYDETLDPIEA
ncbi:MAG TPA: hypothetical protein VJP89_12070 [Pyrinomonadaceae bacterium]|nr:hypothetical protein [Pyrinomonadaceae bacterium]